MSDIYEIKWEQHMGAGRGLNMAVTTGCWETGLFVWRKLFADGLPITARDIAVTYCGMAFDPAGVWPRKTCAESNVAVWKCLLCFHPAELDGNGQAWLYLNSLGPFCRTCYDVQRWKLQGDNNPMAEAKITA